MREYQKISIKKTDKNLNLVVVSTENEELDTFDIDLTDLDKLPDNKVYTLSHPDEQRTTNGNR